MSVAAAAFMAAAAFSQAPSSAAVQAAEIPYEFPISYFFAADNDAGAWRPDWPVPFPPDAFTVSGGSAREIELSVEGESAEAGEGVSDRAVLRRDGHGRVTEFPYPQEGGFVQVSVGRTPRGRVGRIAVSPSETRYAFASATDGLPESASVTGQADRSYASYSFRGVPHDSGSGGVVETRYDSEGRATGVFDYAFRQGRIRAVRARSDSGETDTLLSLDYDSAGRVVAVAGKSFVAEALYDGAGRVVRWKGGTEGEESERAFQWDERGLLVREIGTNADGRIEYRYEYSFDARGNWIERRSSRWTERFGSLVGEDGSRIKRKILYR